MFQLLSLIPSQYYTSIYVRYSFECNEMKQGQYKISHVRDLEVCEKLEQNIVLDMVCDMVSQSKHFIH